MQYLTASEGAAAVFWGTNNYLKSDIQFTLGSCTSSSNAGCFKLTGSILNEVTFNGNNIAKFSPSFTVHKAAGDGGFLYMTGMTQIVNMKEYSTPISS